MGGECPRKSSAPAATGHCRPDPAATTTVADTAPPGPRPSPRRAHPEAPRTPHPPDPTLAEDHAPATHRHLKTLRRIRQRRIISNPIRRQRHRRIRGLGQPAEHNRHVLLGVQPRRPPHPDTTSCQARRHTLQQRRSTHRNASRIDSATASAASSRRLISAVSKNFAERPASWALSMTSCTSTAYGVS